MIDSSIQSLLMRDVDTNMRNISRNVEKMTPDIDSMENDLSSLVCTEESLLMNNLNSIESDALALIPSDFTNLQGDLQSAINACNYLKNNPLLNDPMRFLKQISSQFMNNIFNMSFGLSGLPELQLSSQLLNYQNILTGLGLDKILPGLNSMMYCLELRGVDMSSYGNDLTSMMGSLHVDPSGLIDYPSLYGSSGMSTCQQNNMYGTMSSVDNVKNEVNDYTNQALSQASTWI